MLKFSKKVEYALISMLYMAKRESGELTTSRELSEHFNIPQELAGKVLQSLARTGCIASVQGVKGGYQLASAPELINLTAVITAVDGPIKVVNCVEEPGQCGCDQLRYCNMRNPMETIQSKLIEFFNAITLKDLQTNLTAFNLSEAVQKNAANVTLNFKTN